MFSSLVVKGTLVHAIDLAALVESSDVIVSGSASSVTEEGTGTINTACGTLTGKKLLLVLLPDETIKGAAETASLPVELGIPEAPCAIRGVPSQQYGIFFLQRKGPGYRFSDPMYPFLPAVRGGGSTTGSPLDRVVAKLGETLTYERSTEVEIISALDALATIQRDSATQTLRQALETTKGEVQLRIAWQLVAHNDMTGLNLVERALSHPATLSDYWLLNLAGSLGGLKDPRAVPALKRLLETNNQRIIKGAAIALRQSGSADALEPLSRLLTNNDEQVRYYAVVGMGEITRQDEWTPAFPEFREHEAKYVSYWREWAVSNLPPNVYIDKGACPFECCTYREWVGRTDMTLLDSPNGKKVVGQIKKGEKVLALTGEVHSVPLRVTAKDDYPDAGVKAGDTIYILHYQGEGYWTAWHNGRVINIENFSEEAKQPKATWWVKLKTRTGVIGWTVSHGNFGNQDACE